MENPKPPSSIELRNRATIASSCSGLAAVPTLLIHGVLSDVLNDDIAGRMRARKPDLEYVAVPNRGHTPLLDEPECLAAIDEFLSRLVAPAGD